MDKDAEGITIIFRENKSRGVSYAWPATPGRLCVVPELADYELSGACQDVDTMEAAKKAIAELGLETSQLAAAYVFDDKGRVVCSATRPHTGGVEWKEFTY